MVHVSRDLDNEDVVTSVYFLCVLLLERSSIYIVYPSDRSRTRLCAVIKGEAASCECSRGSGCDRPSKASSAAVL